MNWDHLKGRGQPLSGHAKSNAGKRAVLIGRIQERYGMPKEDAEKQVDGWIASYGPNAYQSVPVTAKEGHLS